jgi:hypothetical protein
LAKIVLGDTLGDFFSRTHLVTLPLLRLTAAEICYHLCLEGFLENRLKCCHETFCLAGFYTTPRVGNTVTRLGEFLPVGSLLTLACFLQNVKRAQIIRLLFTTVQVMY